MIGAINVTSKAEDKVNMAELVGNTDGFADSGLVRTLSDMGYILTQKSHSVSSAIVQRYLDPILKAALDLQPQIQAAAVDILTFTIRQGLAHPLQVSRVSARVTWFVLPRFL